MKVLRLIFILALLIALVALAVPHKLTKLTLATSHGALPRVVSVGQFSSIASEANADREGSGNRDGSQGSRRGRGSRGSLDCFTSELARDDTAGPLPPFTMRNLWTIERDGYVTHLTPSGSDRLNQNTSRSQDSRALDEGNDHCPAREITTVPYSDSGTLKEMHADYESPCAYLGLPDVIYRFVPSQSRRFILIMGGTMTSGVLTVSTGVTCPGIQSVNCTSGELANNTRVLRLTINATANVPYYITLSGDTSNHEYNYTFSLREGLECQADFDMTAPGSVSGNTCFAHDNCPLTFSEDQIVHVTIPRTARWTFGLCDGQSWDARIYLTRSCCSDTLITSSSSGCPWNTRDWTSRPLLSAVALTAGDYYLRVEGAYANACGPWTLTVEEALPGCTTPPPNDNIANAGAPVSLPTTFTGNNQCSTHDCNLLTRGSGEVWHAFQIDAPTDVTLDFCGMTTSYSSFYNVLVTGSPCQSLVECSEYSYINCADSWSYVVVFRNLAAGVYYLPILWDSLYGNQGPYVVNVRNMPSCVIQAEAGDVQECPETIEDVARGYDCDGGCYTNRGFQQISIGQSVFGRMFSYLVPPYNHRYSDVDWYEFTLEDTGSVNLSINAQFPVQVGIYERDCSYQYSIVDGQALLPCSTLTLSTNCLRPHTYAVGIRSAGYLMPVDPVNYRFTLTSTSCTWPIDLVQETGDQLENEPVCQDEYHDQYNSGCDYSDIFQNITCGTTILGTSGVFRRGSYYTRDTDWYRVVTTTPSILDVAVLSEFDPYIILSNYCPGCDGGMVEVSGSTGDTLHATTWCVAPGSYFIGVFPTDGPSLQCGTQYRMWVNSNPCTPCSDLNEPGDIVESEPACSTYYEYFDHFNGGCTSNPPVYGPAIRCGQAVWGRTGTGYGNSGPYRDTDWMSFNLAATESPLLNVVAQFPVMAAIVGPGSGNTCDSVVLYSEVMTGNPCDTVRVAPHGPLNAGTYWLYVAPSAYRNIICGMEYRAWVTCAGCQPDTVRDLTIRRVGNDIVLRWTADPSFAGTYTVYHSTSYPVNAVNWELLSTGVAPQQGDRRTIYTHANMTNSEVESQYYMVVGVCP